MLDVRRLRILRELQLRGTLAAVAEALHQSPSSVSQQLAQLEREVGVELLRKSGRRVVLTPQAEILIGHTAAVLERLERAESEVASSLTEAVGTLRVAIFQSALLALVPAAISHLSRDHAGLRVSVTQREPETALYETWARDFDLVVAEQYPDHAAPWHEELDRQDLLRDEIRLALPPSGPDWATAGSIRELAAAPWVMEQEGVASRHWAEQACRSAGFEPDVRFETPDLQAHVRLVESGHAVALLPDLIWADHDADVRHQELEGRPRRTIFTSARRASAGSPAIRACREALAAGVPAEWLA